jgi:hypothetical protein
MSVTAIYSFEAADGKAEELVAMLQQGRDFTMTIEGCQGFEVFQGKDDPEQVRDDRKVGIRRGPPVALRKEREVLCSSTRKH